MSINTKESYIEIGTSVNTDNSLNNVLHIPAPIELPSANEFLADAGRNANGTMVLEQIGRTQYKSEITFASLPNKKWWEINRWFDDFGYVFYMKYFSHTDGMVKIHRFYRGNVKQGIPSSETEVLEGYVVPKRYKGCGFSVIDMGEYNVKVVKEISL